MSSNIPLPPNDNRAPVWLGLYYSLTAVALALVMLRCWVRVRITGGWGWDDTTILIAWGFLFIGLVMTQLESNMGLGRHIEYLTEENLLRIRTYNTFFQMDNTATTFITKVSISFFILRIKNTSRTRKALIVLMTLMGLATLQTWIVLGLSCIPLRKLWTPSIPGQCLPLNTLYITAYVQSAFTILVDLCLTASPVIILWNVKIDLKRKILICTLMGLGLTATISNVLRNVFTSVLISPDLTYDIEPVLTVAVLELSSGIIAACIPPCLPFFKSRARGKVSLEQTSSTELTGSTCTANSLKKQGRVTDSELESMDA